MPQLKTVSNEISNMVDAKLTAEITKLLAPLGLKNHQRLVEIMAKLCEEDQDLEPIPIEDTVTWQELAQDEKDLFGPILVPINNLAGIYFEIPQVRQVGISTRVKENLWRKR